MDNLAQSFDDFRHNHFMAFLSISVLLIGLFAGLTLIKTPQRLERQAAAVNDVKLNLIATNPVNAQVAPGSTITIAVQIDSPNKTVSASKINVNVPNAFEFVSFTPGNFLSAKATNGLKANGTRGQLSTIDINAKASTPIPYFTSGVATLNVGTPCDECYIGSAGSGGYVQCPINPAPQCYPNKGSGQLALLTLRAKTNSNPGTYNVNVLNSSQVAAIEVVNDDDGNDNVLNMSQLGTLQVTITGTGGGTACDLFNLDGDGDIDANDIQNAIINHWNSVSGQPRYNANFDIHPENAPDGDIDASDVQNIIIKHWNTTCS